MKEKNCLNTICMRKSKSNNASRTTEKHTKSKKVSYFDCCWQLIIYFCDVVIAAFQFFDHWKQKWTIISAWRKNSNKHKQTAFFGDIIKQSKVSHLQYCINSFVLFYFIWIFWTEMPQHRMPITIFMKTKKKKLKNFNSFSFDVFVCVCTQSSIHI